MDKRGDLRQAFNKLARSVKLIGEGIEEVTGSEQAYAIHPKLGNVSCSPAHVGTGMRAAMTIQARVA